MLTRNIGRPYIYVGVPRLSRIDEEQVDRVSINRGNESPMSSPDCSSSQSTPLPPFPSPPLLPTPPSMTTGIELMTTPPPPPPPDDYTTSPPRSAMTRLSTADVDSVLYNGVDQHRRVARALPGDVVRLQMPAKSTDMIAFDRDVAAVRFIKEKYDSLGKALIDRTLTYDTPLSIPSNVGGVGGGVGAKQYAEAPFATTTAETPLSLTSPYQVPSSIPCCRSTIPPTVHSNATAANQSCSSSGVGNGGSSVAARAPSLTENSCQSHVGCHSQHATTTQPCQNHQQQQKQQHHQHHQHHRQCGCHGSHALLQSSHLADVRDLSPNTSCQSSKFVEKDDPPTPKSILTCEDQVVTQS